MTFVNDAPLPLPGMPDNTPAPPAVQMTSIGQPQPIRIPEHLWRSWLDDPAVVSRFESKRIRHRREQCWPWIGGVPSTGHGSFRAACPPGPSHRGTVPGAFVRLPARIQCHLEVGLVQHRRRGAVPSMRRRRLHQPGTHAVGNQSQQPRRIRTSTTQHRQPTRRRSRTHGSHSRHRRRDPYRDRTERGSRHHRRAHRCVRDDRTPALAPVATQHSMQVKIHFQRERITLQYNAFHR